MYSGLVKNFIVKIPILIYLNCWKITLVNKCTWWYLHKSGANRSPSIIVWTWNSFNANICVVQSNMLQCKYSEHLPGNVVCSFLYNLDLEEKVRLKCLIYGKMKHIITELKINEEISWYMLLKLRFSPPHNMDVWL